MKQSLLLIISIIFIKHICGQRSDVGTMPMQGNTPFLISGQQFNTVKFSRLVEGSPYLFDEFIDGTITNKQGLKYKGVKLKLDLLANQLHYIDENGSELQLITVVENISIKDREAMGELTFSFVPQTTAALPWGWLELLGKGKSLQIFRRHLKTLEEVTPYGSATREQHILTTLQFWVLFENKWVRVKRLEDVAEIHAEKRKEILAFIRANKLMERFDEDWAKLAAAF